MRSCDQRSPVQSGAGRAPTLSAMNERAHCRCKAGLSLNRMSVNGLTIALRSATRVSSRGISSAELRLGMIGPPTLGLVEILQRLAELAERRQRAAAIVERIGIVRPQLEGALIALDRLVVVLEALQRIAAVVVRLDMARGARQHLVEALKRLLVAFEPLQGVAAVVDGIDRGGLDGQGLVEALERLLVAAQRVEDQSLVR